MVGIINLGVAAALAGPVAGFVAGPLFRRKQRGTWVPVLADADLIEGATQSVTYTLDVQDGYMTSPRRYSAFVMRQNGKVTALDPSCPHLGCHVEFKERKQRFICPCHGGVFSADGERVSGPPPRGLSRIAAKVEDGRIWLYRA
jgi:menaquinol-cytochrome c reductase iron-sulfur subunit